MKWIKLFENYVMTNHDITLKDELESFVKITWHTYWITDLSLNYVERTYGFDSDHSLEFLLYKPVSNRSELLSILILNMT
jgi:hypothetical protein